MKELKYQRDIHVAALPISKLAYENNSTPGRVIKINTPVLKTLK